MSDKSGPKVDLTDVQSLIVRNHRNLPHAYFLALVFPEQRVATTRKWLSELRDRVTRASMSNDEVGRNGSALNVAFTASGLTKLGLDEDVMGSFPREIAEGMTTVHRRRLLGDEGPADPEKWRWGGPKTCPVDAMLFLYASTEEVRDRRLFQEVKDFAGSAGIGLVTDPIQSMLIGLDGPEPRRKEHFGFDDGLSQPYIRAFDSRPPCDLKAEDLTPVGEVLLGYQDVYEQYPESPVVSDDEAARRAKLSSVPDVGLAAEEDEKRQRSLGHNGSYVVFRQLTQDVSQFWRTLDGYAEGNAEKRRYLAEKIVGRRMDGKPLGSLSEQGRKRSGDAMEETLRRPYGEDPHFERQGDVTYADDLPGSLCPVAAHVRRSNPRDGLGETEDVGRLARRRRLLRRGRPFGRPFDPRFDPETMAHKDPDGVDRGINFITFNTDIARQFEFVQQTWVNSMKFNGLYNEPDPLVAPHPEQRDNAFTIRTGGIRRRLLQLPTFVTMVGGAYLFMPSLRALAYLADPSRPVPPPAPARG
jgi:Dyp-type peroxidase family